MKPKDKKLICNFCGNDFKEEELTLVGVELYCKECLKETRIYDKMRTNKVFGEGVIKIKCDECEIEVEKKDTVKTVDGKTLCFGCDSKRLEKENSTRSD